VNWLWRRLVRFWHRLARGEVARPDEADEAADPELVKWNPPPGGCRVGALQLPEPMLAKPDRLPRGDYSYEVKWDGFRALVATEDGVQVRSRSGWVMTDRVPELAGLPTGLVLDGELVTFGLDGRPSFPLLGLRVLHGRTEIPVTLMIFDLLRVEGTDAMCLPYAERRALLEELDLNGPAWRTPEVFDDGEALFDATSRLVLEGVVAKRRSESYRPGERRWAKTKHRSYWRFGQELERAQRRPEGGSRSNTPHPLLGAAKPRR
jgi:bifunctional non-homologous end joining protein LigD